MATKPLAGISVLIVDDDPDARYVLETMLTHAGALAITAESGKEALGILSAVQVAVIVSDISMLGLSGHDFIRAVRQLPSPQRDTPALAVTAFGERGQRDRALKAGFQAFHVKPIGPELLAAEVARLAGRGSQTQSEHP